MEIAAEHQIRALRWYMSISKKLVKSKNARVHPSGRHLLRITMGQMPKVSFDEPVDGLPLTPNCGLGLLGGTK